MSAAGEKRLYLQFPFQTRRPGRNAEKHMSAGDSRSLPLLPECRDDHKMTSAASEHLWPRLTLVQSSIWQLLIPVPIKGFLHCQELMGQVTYPKDICFPMNPPSWL